MNEPTELAEPEHHQTTAVGDDPISEDEINNAELIRTGQINDRIVIRKNRILYRELRRDFSPIVAGLIGLVVGALLGILLGKLIGSDSTMIAGAILGAFVGVTSYFNKDRTGEPNE